MSFYPEGSDEVKVRQWRLKLQKLFLSEFSPKDEDMPELDNLFTEVEEFPMTISCFQYSKIGKAMRHIGRLEVDKVPHDEEFHFRKRALALVEKWNEFIDTSSMKVKDGHIIASTSINSDGQKGPGANFDAETVDEHATIKPKLEEAHSVALDSSTTPAAVLETEIVPGLAQLSIEE